MSKTESTPNLEVTFESPDLNDMKKRWSELIDTVDKDNDKFKSIIKNIDEDSQENRVALTYAYNHIASDFVDSTSEMILPYNKITLKPGINVIHQAATGVYPNVDLVLHKIEDYCDDWNIPCEVKNMQRYSIEELIPKLVNSGEFGIIDSIIRRTPAEQMLHMNTQCIESEILPRIAASHKDNDIHEIVICLDNVDYGCASLDVGLIIRLWEIGYESLMQVSKVPLYLVFTSKNYDWVRKFGAIEHLTGNKLPKGMPYSEYLEYLHILEDYISVSSKMMGGAD